MIDGNLACFGLILAVILPLIVIKWRAKNDPN